MMVLPLLMLKAGAGDMVKGTEGRGRKNGVGGRGNRGNNGRRGGGWS